MRYLLKDVYSAEIYERLCGVMEIRGQYHCCPRNSFILPNAQ
jgi:hypothetical protein